MIVNKRNSGIELLRIVSMLVIIAHHYVVNSGISEFIMGKSILSIKDYIMLIYGWGGKTAINCFLLITGYYMCDTKASLRKWLRLLGELEFYLIVIYSIFVVMGYEQITFGRILKVIFPFREVSWGFSTCYLLFYALIPFLNKLVNSMDQKEHALLIGLCLLIYTILPSLAITVIVFNYITWFCIVYIIGAYIRRHPFMWLSNKIKTGGLMLGSVLLSWGSVVGFSVLGRMLGKGGHSCYFWVNDVNQILAVVTAICTFLFFRSFEHFFSGIINRIAASTFGVLLIHANSDAMRQWLWRDKLNNLSAYEQAFPYWLLHAVASVIIVYIVCTLIDQGRMYLADYLRGLFARKERTD